MNECYESNLPESVAGMRLDQALAELYPQFSRNRLRDWIKRGRVRLDGGVCKPGHRLLGGERLRLEPEEAPSVAWSPEPVDFPVLYQDEDLLVIDKPAGLVVHPAAGHWSGTLVNGLLHRFPDQAKLPRAGVVHRLDKDTTGLMVVARSRLAHDDLIAKLRVHAVRREYRAVVQGVLTAGGSVDAPIGRHPVNRKRMAVREGGWSAVTHFEIGQRYQAHTALKIRLETGRTHQIRVHMAHLRHPLVGDPVYGGRPRFPAGAGEALRERLGSFPRQALHAARLGFDHPRDGRPMVWEAPLPDDLQDLLDALHETL